MMGLWVATQYALCVSLVFSAAKRMKNTPAASLAAALYCSSKLAFLATGMGQETGLLTVSFLGMFNLLIRARKQNAHFIILASAVTAIGMLARDYGGITLIGGGTIVTSRGLGRRSLLLYVGLSFLLFGPRYLHTWLVTGNPFYSIKTLFIYSIHLRYNAMMTSARSQIWADVEVMSLLTELLRIPALPFLTEVGFKQLLS